MSTRHVTQGCKPTAAVISANMLELQLQTNCRCDICKQHVGITAETNCRCTTGDRERHRERERERTHRERQKDRKIVTAANQLPLLHMTFPYPGHAFKEKRGPAYLIRQLLQ